MANNRELSQFASFINVDDTSKAISFASTISSVNVSGVSTFNNVVVGGGTSALVVSGDLNVTGIISSAQFGGEAIINSNRIIQVGGASSTARAANLVAAINDLSKKKIGPGIAITIQLAAGEYFFTQPLRLRGEGSGITILGFSTSGTKPGTTGNHYYNQSGVANGVNPATVGASSSLSEYYYDNTSPAGAYPNPMVAGRGKTIAARNYNEGIIESYYTSRLKFFNCDGIVSNPEGSAFKFKNLAIVGAGQSDLNNRNGVVTTDDIVTVEVTVDPVDGSQELSVLSSVRNQVSGEVFLENVDIHNFYHGILSSDNGSVICNGVNITCNTSVGAYAIRGYIPSPRSIVLNNGVYGVVATQKGQANYPSSFIGNNGNHGLSCHNNSFSYCEGSRFYNNGQSGMRSIYGGVVFANKSWIDGNAQNGVLTYYTGTVVNVSNTSITNNGDYGLFSLYGSQIVGTGLTISYNDQGVRCQDGANFGLSDVGITSNRVYGVAMLKHGHAYIFGPGTEIYDNNGSTAGSGVDPTEIQVLATGTASVALAGWGVTSTNKHGVPAALSPNLNTMGNGNAVIWNTSGTTFTGAGDTSFPRAVEAGT